jgi:hypothetical protein
MDDLCSTHRREEKCIHDTVETLAGNSSLGRPRRRMEDIIKTDLKEKKMRGCELGSSGLGTVQWWAFVNTVMNLQVS